MCHVKQIYKLNCHPLSYKLTLILALKQYEVLLDFSLTVKAATLIFISWHGSAISYANAKEGKSGFICNMVKSS